MDRLRVAQVVLSLAPGGTERLVVDLVRRTTDRCDSMVCCLDEPGEWGLELARDGFPVFSLERRPGFRPTLAWRVATLVRRYKCQVLHCHQYTPFIYGGLAAALTGSGLVFTEHGRLSDAPPSRKRKAVNPVVGRLSGTIFSVSHDLRRHMIAEGFPATRVGVIHNGIDPGQLVSSERRATIRRSLAPSGGQDLLVGTAARLDAVKDLGTMITAFGEFHRHRAASRLIIFGDGPERGHLEALCRGQQLDGAVSFAGHRADVRDFLPALDVFVNSSTSEGISLTILEAMAAALPVVATRVGGTPEIVVADETGILVPPRDPARIAAALLDLSGQPDLRIELGNRGRARVLAHFTIDRMVSDYLAQYEQAVRRMH